MKEEDYIKRLEEKGIRPTAVRLLVVQTLAKADAPLSLSDIEGMLDTVPKSTIFRALTLFLEHRLLHSIEDGSGSLKYELCHGHDDCSINDMHTHFYCERCQRTFCFKSIGIPAIDLPEGFTMNSANYIIKGTCNDCSSKD